MLTLSLESNDREPGTIYRSLICKENPPNNRSHPTTGNDSTRERFMPAPTLALIVPTRSIVPGREPGSRERFTHLGGSSTVTVVMVTAYCYGRRTHTCPRQKGSFLAIFQYGGRERAIPLPSGRKTGLPPGVTGYQPLTRQISATDANRVRAQVCTGAVASARVRALARVGARSGGEAGANRKPCKPCFLARRWRSAALAPPVLLEGEEGPVSPVAGTAAKR